MDEIGSNWQKKENRQKKKRREWPNNTVETGIAVHGRGKNKEVLNHKT